MTVVGVAVLVGLIVLAAGAVVTWRLAPALLRATSAGERAPTGTGTPQPAGAAPRSSGASEQVTGDLAAGILTPGTGLLAGWQDGTGLTRDLRPDSYPATFCHRSLPRVTATKSVGSWGIWTASSSLQPQGETLRSFGQSLSRVGVTQATDMLAALRSAVTACRTYRTSPDPPNTMGTVDTYTVRPDLSVKVGDEAVGVQYDDIDISRAGRMDTYTYLIAFRVGDVLAFTSGSSGVPVTSTDLDKIHQVCFEQVRRLTGHA